MKSERIIGMIVFTATSALLFWYVDYDYAGHIRLVGFGTVPYGYGSPVHRLLDKVFGNEGYTHRSTNFFWTISQIAPLLLSWGLRHQLGRGTACVFRVAQRIYKTI